MSQKPDRKLFNPLLWKKSTTFNDMYTYNREVVQLTNYCNYIYTHLLKLCGKPSKLLAVIESWITRPASILCHKEERSYELWQIERSWCCVPYVMYIYWSTWSTYLWKEMTLGDQSPMTDYNQMIQNIPFRYFQEWMHWIRHKWVLK